VRWYQVGVMAPFFRAHAHIDTKRREPYLLDGPYKGIVKDILRLRYSMLPIWYTAFRETSVTGMPILRYVKQRELMKVECSHLVRPQFIMFPKDKAGFNIDDQYYIGSSGLLVKPITAKDVRETTVRLAEDQVYYDYFTHDVFRGSSKGKEITVPAALDKLPLFIRGGSILATRERPRRASSLMKYDPFTLRIALDKSGLAHGELYLDDGVTYEHQKGSFIWRAFTAAKGKGTKTALRLASTDLAASRPSEAVDGVALREFNAQNAFAKDIKDVRVEKVVVLGLAAKPHSVKVEGGDELQWEFMPGVAAIGKKEGVASVLSIKDPKVLITKDWAIVIQ